MIWLTVQQIAAAADVDDRRVLRWITRDRLPHVPAGQRQIRDRHMIHAVDLREWAERSLAIDGPVRGRLVEFAAAAIGGAA